METTTIQPCMFMYTHMCFHMYVYTNTYGGGELTLIHSRRHEDADLRCSRKWDEGEEKAGGGKEGK